MDQVITEEMEIPSFIRGYTGLIDHFPPEIRVLLTREIAEFWTFLLKGNTEEALITIHAMEVSLICNFENLDRYSALPFAVRSILQNEYDIFLKTWKVRKLDFAKKANRVLH